VAPSRVKRPAAPTSSARSAVVQRFFKAPRTRSATPRQRRYVEDGAMPHFHSLLTTALVLTLAGATIASAQRLSPLYSATPTTHWTSTPALFESRHRAPDYRWEGIIIGGVGGGLLFGYAGNALCRDPDNQGGGSTSCVGKTALGAAFGATLGVVLGGMIGSAIKKKEKS
jgi:hypothetical protein